MTSSILRLAISCPLSFVCLILFTGNKYKSASIYLLGIVVILDLYLTDITLFTPTTKQDQISAKAVELIKNDRTQFRVYSPTYSISQETAENEEIHLAQGVNPMQLAEYVRFMEMASGIPNHSYGVVVPPLIETGSDNGIPNYDTGKPDSKLLGQLNVRYLLSDSQITEPDNWRLISGLTNDWLYLNQAEQSEAYILDKGGNPQNLGVVVEKYTPNEIIISISKGEGDLVLSELIYPGWSAWVDGIEMPIKSYLGIFRMIELSGGAHQIVLKYQPSTLMYGLLFSGITLLALIGSIIKKHANR
jgi:uncharacterized membrane protein YfhO